MTDQVGKPPLSDPMAEALAEDAAAAAARTASTAPQIEPEPTPEPEPEPEPVEAAGEGDADADAPPDPEPKPKEPKSPVKALQGRVGYLTKQLHEREAAAAEMAAQMAAMRQLMEAQGLPAQPPADPSTAPVPVPNAVNPNTGRMYTQAEVQAEAQRIAAASAFNQQANAVYEAGKEKFGDWQESVDSLNALGLMTAQLAEAAFETGSAPDVIYHLGQDTDEASRIASLPPLKMAVEVAKLAGRLSAPKSGPISRAPAPVKPVNGSVKATVDLAAIAKGDDMAAYVAARKAAGDRWAK